ncbi:MAG: flagellar biosynthesis protein FlhF [Dethiobacteria bacterium]
MKIRKYYARDLQEGMHIIKKDLGSEAIILHTRKVRQPGIKGFFSPKQMEIVAALDSRKPIITPPDNNGGRYGFNANNRLYQELNELKGMVHKLVLQNAQAFSDGQEDESVLYWKKRLEDHDLDPSLIFELFEEVKANLEGEVKLNKEILGMILQKKIAQKTKCVEEKAFRHQIFIGPTGVGKTTTLAKVAARYSIYQNENVGLITIDHYRIGAVEQLRTYADIVDLPLEVVMAPDDLDGAKKRLEGCDRILVDTAGRGTGNTMQIKELATYLNAFSPAEIFLVISAMTRWQDIRQIVDSFRQLKFNRLIVTKLDETKAAGAILNGIYVSGLPLVYITDGQNVPDDLQVAREVDIPALYLKGED